MPYSPRRRMWWSSSTPKSSARPSRGGAARARDFPVRGTSSSARKWQAFHEAVAAVAVTGTVTLELALSCGPMVTTYVADRAQWSRARKYKIRFASLPNILVGDELVPEFLGSERRSSEVVDELERLLGDDAQ